MLLKEKKDIIKWLKKYQVKNYTLRPDDTYGYVVDVDDSVCLVNQTLTEIPVKFGTVSGDFICDGNKLTSLEGSPQEVEKDFWCQGNQLTSLEGGPQHVGKNFSCGNNQLISLQGIPDSVGGFFCRGNPELGELQDINDVKTIQSYLLAEKLANELNIKDNKKKVKL